MSLQIVFWGDSQSVFSSRHFEALLNVPCELVAVVDLPPAKRGSTNPLPAGLPNFVDVARNKGIPVFSPADPNKPDFVDRIDGLAPDLFVAVGYALILKPALLAVPKLLAANFHASLLPHYRGKHPVFWALRGGERWAGLTVHAMDPGIDTGDIIYQVKVRTRRDDTVSSLYMRIMDRSVGLIGELAAGAEKGIVPRSPQSAGQGSYFSSITDEDFRIDWSWGAEKIRRHIVMTPGKSFAPVAGRQVYFSQAWITKSQLTRMPGTLLGLGRSRCVVAAGDGAVSIGRARPEDGREQPMASFCRRLGISAGDNLNAPG